jgi:hypothetical protein
MSPGRLPIRDSRAPGRNKASSQPSDSVTRTHGYRQLKERHKKRLSNSGIPDLKFGQEDIRKLDFNFPSQILQLNSRSCSACSFEAFKAAQLS